MRIARSSTGSSAPGRVPATVAVLAAALLVTATGCSSGSSGGGSKALKALGHLRADVNASKQVTYVDQARVRTLSKKDPKRFSRVGQSPSPLLNAYTPGPWGQSLKQDQIDSAVDTSTSGHWDGTFDAAAITASLKKNGYTSSSQDGKQVWQRSGSGSGPRLVISGTGITYATEAAQFSATDPGHGASLADQKDYQLVAGCLGDVYRADFNTLSSVDALRIFALGQQADDAGKNTELLCAVVKDRATADRLAARLRSAVKDNAPRFAGTTVTVDKGDHPVVRATVPDTPAQTPGRLFLTDLQLWQAIADA